MAAGAGIVDETVALSVAREARARVDDLLGFGAPFDRDARGRLTPSQEAAHSARRIVRVKGDGAGAAIMHALIATVRKTTSIVLRENFVAEDLIVQSGRVAGVFARGADGASKAFHARATVLATRRHRRALRLDHQSAAGQRRRLGHGARGPARASPTPNSCNSIPPPSTSAATPRRWRPKPCAAKARFWSIAPASVS